MYDRFGVMKCHEDLYPNWFPASAYNQAPNRPILEKYSDNNSTQLWGLIEFK